MYYRKFKEPLPDPSSPQLVAITLMEEHRFDEFDAVFRRRKLQFKYVSSVLSALLLSSRTHAHTP